MNQFPECGRIVNTHGCRGEVKIESYCDSPQVLCALHRIFLTPDGKNGRHLLHPRVHKGFVIAGLSQVTDMNEAEGLKGQLLYVDREELPIPPGAFLLCDLIGLPMIDAVTGRIYGKVTDVEKGVASDLYTVRTEKGQDVLFPAVPAFQKEIRPDVGIFVTPVEGLFDDI